MGRIQKGILDFLVAAVAALNYIHFNSTYVELATIGVKFYIPPVLFFILTIILVWAAINVTNCSDGVDGLSGTLTIITLVTIYVIDQIRGNETQFHILFYCLLYVFLDIYGTMQHQAV